MPKKKPKNISSEHGEKAEQVWGKKKPTKEISLNHVH